VRITVVEKAYSSEGSFASDVTRFNNTQNVIKVSDFRSNDPIQTWLQRHFDYSRLGKKVAYVPKRTDVKTGSTIIRLEEFSKVIYSFLCDPVRFSGSTSFLFDDSKQGGYRQVFGDGNELWTAMPEDEFRLRSAIWWIADEFSRLVKADRAEATGDEKAALERKWFLLFIARLALQRVFGEQSYRQQIIPTWKGDWRMDDGKEGKFFRELYDVSKRALVWSYLTAKRMSAQKFVHRNWMRSVETVEQIKTDLRLMPSLQLPSLRS
jgi:hypothetical protein